MVSRALVTTSLSVIVASGCALDTPESVVEATPDRLLIISEKVWPSTFLSVCWEQAEFAEEKAWVIDALQESWEAETAVTFDFVGLCSDNAAANIRVMFHDEGGSSYVGTDLDRRRNGTKLNTWMSRGCTGDWSRERCVRSTAVHEFGHALGFMHEQIRADTPESCTAGDGGPAGGDVSVGEWDLGSVMNYCNPVRNGDARLSPTDIWGAQSFYGARRSVALIKHDGYLETFYRGTDHQLWHVYGREASWSQDHLSRGGSLSSAPAAVSWGDGRQDVLARSGNDGHVEHVAFTAESGWGPWQALGAEGSFGGPVAIARGTSALELFVRTASGLRHRSLDAASGWSEWTELGRPPGGDIVGDPAAAAWSADALEVFVRATDNQLWHRWWRPERGWSEWGSLEGSLTSSPVVISGAAGQLDVYARGVDNALWTRWYRGDWSGWQSLGGVINGSVAALGAGSNAMVVVAQGLDGVLSHRRYAGAWTDWRSIPGMVEGAVALVQEGYRLGIASRGADDALLYNDDLDAGEPLPGAAPRNAGWANFGGIIQ